MNQDEKPDRAETTEDQEPAAPAEALEGEGAAIISSLPAKPLAVTLNRKNELLLQARASRLAWIRSVSLPYQKATRLGGKQQEDQHSSVLQSTHAVQKLPSIPQVVSLLYGFDEEPTTGVANSAEVADRVEAVLHSLNISQADRDYAVVTAGEALEAEIEELTAAAASRETTNLPKNAHQLELLESYRDFITRLERPECATLVQSLRNFCLQWKSSSSSASELATSLNSHLDTTYEAILAHAAWKDIASDKKDSVRHSLESFLYGHCQDKIHFTQMTDEDPIQDTECLERWNSLQFLTPSHFDIACMKGIHEDVDQLLADPIEALGAVDSYFSPYEKLQCILRVYHGVNAALTVALNHGLSETNSEGKKLPSADDVLPALILTVLRAKPPRLASNLHMLEVCCPAEYLRGEAGYAYTNLYSAVQFLKDLNMEHPDALSIGADEFREGLEKCRAAVAHPRLFHPQMFHGDTKDNTDVSSREFPLEIPPGAVRAARLQGETVDVEWALRWQKQQGMATPETQSGQDSSQRDGAIDGLPPGFSRSYSFLTSRPEDIRVADLPQLLAEYRMLVHTTEQLLAEQTTKRAAERKERATRERKALMDRAAEIDPTLMERRRKHKSNQSL